MTHDKRKTMATMHVNVDIIIMQLCYIIAFTGISEMSIC